MEEKYLPKAWIECDLNELLEYVTSGSRDWSQYYSDKGVNFIRTQDINQNRLDLSSVAKVALPEKVEGKRTLVLENDILITITGANVGKCARVDISPPESYVSQSVALVRLVNPSMSAFIQRQIIAPVGDQTALQKAAYGMGRPVLNLNNIRDFKVKLPPLAEQKVIADTLDTLLAQVDNTKARLERIPEILKSFRQSVLAAAVSGKLTEEWREVNCINRNQWVKGVLGDFVGKPTYGSSAKSQTSGLVPVLRMGNLQDGKLDWADLVYTSDSAEIEKYKLSFGDVLFNRTNSPELVGKTSIYRGEREAIYAGYLIRVVCKENLNPEFLNYFLNSPYAKDYCYQVKSDGVSQSNINAQKLIALPVNVPTMSEQTEIVRRVKELFAYADRIEQAAQAALSRVNNLTQSILAKAFRGELTADWRTANPDLISGDNSAEALLARIKAERAKLTKKAKAKA